MLRILSAVILVVVFFAAPSYVLSQSASDIPGLQALIRELQTQIKALQARVLSLQSQLQITKEEVAEVKAELKLTRSLSRGASGEEVRQLQEFLRSFPDVYPEGLVTGYYGPLTEAAVKKLQEKQGIEAIGIVGPRTLIKINELISRGAGASGVIPPGLLTAPGIQKQFGTITSTPPTATSTPPSATSTSPQTTSTVPSTTSTTGVTTTTIYVSYVPPLVNPAGGGSGSGSGGNQVSTSGGTSTSTTTASTTTASTTTATDTTPPVISSILATNITVTGATITWATGEPATSQVEYDTAAKSVYGVETPLDSSLTTSHSVSISALEPNVAYQYRVKSKDIAGNAAISDRQTLTTLSLTPTAGNVKWVFTTTDSYPVGNPYISPDGTIYVGSGNLSAVNPNGTLKWNISIGNGIARVSAIGSDGTIYVLSDKLYALNPDGTQKWTYPATGNLSMGSDGTVYIANKAINPNGTLKWTFSTNVEFAANVVASDGTIYLGGRDGKLYALNPDGTLKWTFAVEPSSSQQGWITAINSIALGSSGTIYASAYGGKYLYSVNPDGTAKWTFHGGTGSDFNPFMTIGSDSTIYAMTDYTLYALNPDGAAKWTFSNGSQLFSAATVGSDGVMYIPQSNPNRLTALNSNGSEAWSAAVEGTMFSEPAIASDGTVYVYAYNNKLYAIYSNSSGLANSPWPRSGRNNRGTNNAGDPVTLHNSNQSNLVFADRRSATLMASVINSINLLLQQLYRLQQLIK